MNLHLRKNVNLIYAPNGTMKTSFSKVLKYLSRQLSTKPQDVLNPKAKPEYNKWSNIKPDK